MKLRNVSYLDVEPSEDIEELPEHIEEFHTPQQSPKPNPSQSSSEPPLPPPSLSSEPPPSISSEPPPQPKKSKVKIRSETVEVKEKNKQREDAIDARRSALIKLSAVIKPPPREKGKPKPKSESNNAGLVRVKKILKKDLKTNNLTPADIDLNKSWDTEDVIEKIIELEFPQGGTGKLPSTKAMFDDQINSIMTKYPEYLGTVSQDHIKTLLPKIEPQSRIAFIVNTDKENAPGEHWQAVFADARPEGSQTIEFYDSFGRDPPKTVQEDLRLVANMLKAKTYLKLKINKVIAQHDDTNTCGQHCLKFLIDRFRGKTFAEATGWDNTHKIDEADKQANKLQGWIKNFGYM